MHRYHFSVITVPGVTTLMTSRLTMPLTALGSSSCSQIATLYPFFHKRFYVAFSRMKRERHTSVCVPHLL